MNESVLIIAAHPDDEIIGCGGTIAKHTENGDEVNIVIVAEGATSRSQNRSRENSKNELQELSKAAKNSSKIIGSKSLEILNLPDNRLDSIEILEIIKIIESKISKYNPTIIYTHHYGDLNIDHQIIHNAVLTAARPVPDSSIKKVLSFEIASSTEWNRSDSNIFKPNYFVSIEKQISKKIEALKFYKSEMREWPHPRSYENILNLAKVRGSQVGYEYAEAFCLIRQIA